MDLRDEWREKVARTIWDTSRADEGTISATGANIIADALLAPGGVVAEMVGDVRARVEAVLAEGPDTWEGYQTYDIGHAYLAETVHDFLADLRRALGGGE